MVRRNDVYANIGWQTGLRGDRDERNAQSKASQKKQRKSSDQ